MAGSCHYIVQVASRSRQARKEIFSDVTKASLTRVPATVTTIYVYTIYAARRAQVDSFESYIHTRTHSL